MDAKTAIELLEISGDRLVSDNETACEIAALIERQEKMLARACEKFNSMGLCTQEMDACADFDNCAECWRKWLEEAGE